MLLTLFFLALLSRTAVSSPTRNASDHMLLQEKSYSKWLNRMSYVTHSQSNKEEKNQLEPCLTITVNRKKNKGDFRSIQKAIDSLPVMNQCRVVISIHAGKYKEKVEIPNGKAYISLEGAGAEKTVIVWGDRADKKGKDGQVLGTYGSATIAINSPYFIAKHITFKNKAPLQPSGALGKQAVALRISADRAAFIGCRFIGTQDTLYDHFGRHYFKNCYIEGSVDFIFGNGLSLYDGCHLHAITNSYGALTAQKRNSMLEDTGFSFINCKVTGSGALYLGRAWGSFSRVIFAYTYMDKIITERGWYNWGDKNREMTVFYGQYKCSGPGAEYGGRVKWSRELTKQEAKPFLSLSFIDGHEWLPHLEP